MIIGRPVSLKKNVKKFSKFKSFLKPQSPCKDVYKFCPRFSSEVFHVFFKHLKQQSEQSSWQELKIFCVSTSNFFWIWSENFYIIDFN